MGLYKDLSRVTAVAVERYPHSVPLWLERLRTLADLLPPATVSDTVLNEVNTALDSVKEKVQE